MSKVVERHPNCLLRLGDKFMGQTVTNIVKGEVHTANRVVSTVQVEKNLAEIRQAND